MTTLREEVRNARRLPSPAMAKLIRQQAGVSQTRLAKELGVHYITVLRWENGSRVPRGETRARYAALLAEIQQELSSA